MSRMASNNAQIAAIFQRMADVLQILDANRFKVIAFQRAARVVDELAQDVADIEPSELKRIDGIGKGTAERIAEFLDTGRIADHDELVEEVPEGLFKLLDIPGMGAKTVALLWNQGQVTDIDGLKAAIESGQLEQLPGLGKKKLENIRNNIAFAETASQRTRLGVALPLAKSIVQALEQLPDVKRIDFAGSLRRGQETIGDIDILVATGKQGASKIADVFVNLDGVASVSAQGSTKCSVRTQDDIQIDLRMVPPASYGAALMYFTGSKEHNVAMRERAQSMGMTLNEYRLENKKTGRAVAGKTEEDVFAALKLDWIPPELRQDRGEIALAQQHALPALIELADVRSELHAHTTASDGHWSIEELADACAARGFHTVAVTDHSKGQAQANGLDNKRLERHIKQVRKVAERMKGTITILAGSEVTELFQ